LAVSLCGKCGGKEFELTNYSADASDAGLRLFQCAQCGAVIGVFDAAVFEKIKQIEERLKLMDRRLTNIEYDIDTINKKRK